MRDYNPQFTFHKETILLPYKIETKAATVPEHSEEGVWMKTYRYAFTVINDLERQGGSAHYFQGHDLESDEEELQSHHEEAVKWLELTHIPL